MASPSGSRKVVYAALIGNLAVASAKFVAAAISGSSAMLSEGVHSLVDTTNEGLLLYGLHRAGKEPDRSHPFGYGRELYFWSFVVALLVLAVGAGISLYEGVTHILKPEAAGHLVTNLVVLGVAMLFEGTTWVISLREFRRQKGAMGYFEAFRKSKDPATFTVLLEDSAALAGLLIALVGLLAAHWLQMPVLDGIASVGIGLVLAVDAILLARETKGLLIGEPAAPELGDAVLAIAAADRDVRHANGILTVQMGPRQVVVALSLEFEDARTVPEIEDCIDRIERQAKGAHAEVTALFFKPQTAGTWQRQLGMIDEDAGDS
ncbi:MAG: cation diffusion facilitator family transporter [Pseudomonadota bacterium]|nr:cation diffusion facilitator family transporter [Pseudomonadota bacterium]